MSATTVQPDIETESVAVQLPKTLKDWVERKALERKQRTGGRFAVSPIIVELIERAKREDEGGGR